MVMHFLLRDLLSGFTPPQSNSSMNPFASLLSRATNVLHRKGVCVLGAHMLDALAPQMLFSAGDPSRPECCLPSRVDLGFGSLPGSLALNSIRSHKCFGAW